MVLTYLHLQQEFLFVYIENSMKVAVSIAFLAVCFVWTLVDIRVWRPTTSDVLTQKLISGLKHVTCNGAK